MVSTFAVLRFIQTFAFLLFRHAHADGEVLQNCGLLVSFTPAILTANHYAVCVVGFLQGRLHMVSTFPVLRFIQTFAFLLFRHAQADGEIDDLKGDIRYDSRPN